ncbi:MAG: tRNA (guanosine(46)-N7)-methyltransferase TrmB [Desulfobacterales bacterium]|nr:tRNA (guanosine(46)-N7)-methyltransferase TrmB [Desulfobacterales bacterium]
MPKVKKQRYERVKTLHNVFTPDENEPDASYPWNASQYTGKKIILELGCGKGEHSLGFAGDDPDCLCIGVDLKSHRLCVGAEKAIAQGIDNVLFLRVRIEHISTFFQQDSIHGIWLTFPDPHPKQRSIKHRLSSPNFLNQYARLLLPGGKVHLKTDSNLLYTYTRQSVIDWGGQILSDSNDLHGEKKPKGAGQIVSTFETKALARGKTIKYLSFTLN